VVPVSMVSRVEDGEVDPTITVMQRMLSASGRQMRLGLEAIPKQRSLAALADASNLGSRPEGQLDASPRILGLASLASTRGRSRDIHSSTA